MRAKKIINFLILRPAFTSRNMSSLGLVALFFALYILAGGKVTWIPDIKAGQGFGTVNRSSVTSQPSMDEAPTMPNVMNSADVQKPVTVSPAQAMRPNVVEKPALAGKDENAAESEDSYAKLRERLKNVRTNRAE